MHVAAYEFVQSVAPVDPGAVLEIGSYIVNGSVRPLFDSATSYVGTDVRGGPGVDVVTDCADYDGAGVFDTVVSTEVMEHMRHPQELIECAARALKPGGLLILTAAGPRRPHHGVDGGDVSNEHYGNITPEALKEMLSGWKNVKILHNDVAHDVYATAVKKATK
jgi:SAM-dependent methyltransferase